MRNGVGGKKDQRSRSAVGSSTMTEPVPELGEEWGSEKGKVAHETGENSWEDDRLKKGGQEKKGGTDGGDPANRKWNGDGEKEDLLVRKSGGEAKEE